MPHTRAMKGKIAMGRKQLGLDEDTYRAMLYEVTGKNSTTVCTASELARLIDHLARKGAVFATARGSKKPYTVKASQRRSDWYEIPDGPLAPLKRKICALWHELGYDMTSLDTRVLRQSGTATLLWCKDEKFLHTLARDLSNRVARKMTKNAAGHG